MTAAALPVWAEQLISEFDESDARVKALTAGLTTPQLNWHPQPGAWSIGQCIEHLAIANDIYIEAIAGALANRQPDGPVDEIVLGRFSRYFLRTFIEPTPTTRRA